MHLEANPIGRVYLPRLDVALSQFDVVEPDLLYISNETAARVITPQNVRGAPDLVAEIASPGTRKRDATIKYQLYERSGVAEYWIIDPDANVVRIYRSEDGRFRPPIELSRETSDILRAPLLPGFELPLERLFRD
jgi:Uma2 family endonuclease